MRIKYGPGGIPQIGGWLWVVALSLVGYVVGPALTFLADLGAYNSRLSSVFSRYKWLVFIELTGSGCLLVYGLYVWQRFLTKRTDFIKNYIIHFVLSLSLFTFISLEFVHIAAGFDPSLSVGIYNDIIRNCIPTALTAIIQIIIIIYLRLSQRVKYTFVVNAQGLVSLVQPPAEKPKDPAATIKSEDGVSPSLPPHGVSKTNQPVYWVIGALALTVISLLAYIIYFHTAQPSVQVASADKSEKQQKPDHNATSKAQTADIFRCVDLFFDNPVPIDGDKYWRAFKAGKEFILWAKTTAQSDDEECTLLLIFSHSALKSGRLAIHTTSPDFLPNDTTNNGILFIDKHKFNIDYRSTYAAGLDKLYIDWFTKVNADQLIYMMRRGDTINFSFPKEKAIFSFYLYGFKEASDKLIAWVNKSKKSK